jgi:hypothetical protein
MRAEPVKFAEGSETRLKILAIPFGGLPELGGKDLDDEYFTAKSDLCTSWYPVTRPLLYEHGKHADVEVDPVGKVDSTTVTTEDEVGVWVEAELDRQAQYYEHIRRMVEQKKLYASSGAMGHLVKRAKDGHLDRWPWVELSLTPTPANPLARVEAKTAVKHYEAAGITPPPTMDDDDTRSYADLLDRLTDDIGDFTDLTSRLTEGRVKVGRPISEARRRRLGDLMERMRASASEIEALLAETEGAATPPPPAAAAGEDVEAAGGAEEGAGTEGKAAHAPPELLAIFTQFQKESAFYGSLLPGRTRRTA